MTTYATRPAAPAKRPPARPLPRPALRHWWGDAVGSVVWATALVVVALWIQHGGIQDVTAGLGQALSSLGRLTGLVASDLLLLQVLAMARIPWAERSLGQDRLARWHRILGFSSFNLMVAHIVLIVIGYAVLDHSPVLGELWGLVTTAPGMLIATAGTALLVLVTVTSIRVARRRLRYESWHLLHLYAYLGVGLALPHQLWTGADFLASPAATIYWWGLWALAATAVVVFRGVLPLRRSLRHRLTVASVTRDTKDVVSIRITGHRLDELNVAPGQFFVWRFRGGRGWTRGHPLSLSAAPTTDGLRITLNVRGDDGARLARLPTGTSVLVEGPYGRLTPEVRTRTGLALVGSGLGLAPLVAILQDAVRTGSLTRQATVVRRLRSTGRQPFDKDLEELTRTGWVRVVDLIGPRSTNGTPWLPAESGHVPGPDALRQLIPDLADCDVYICGTSPWAAAVAADARDAGLPANAVHVEHFSW
ncbi:MAG TPA: ferric reductase-like transmembrane domain-containing protein [Actinotalea sp.]